MTSDPPARRAGGHWRRPVKWAALGILALFVIAQAVPYGRSHGDPRVTRAVRFDSRRTEQLVRDACADCHSNLTTWPWYSNVAPVSWLVQHDVDDGRNRMNFSQWDQPQPDLGEVIQQLSGGGMPPRQYKILHSASRLSDAERAELA